MKNNFITKIIGATLAFAMMIGVGATASNKRMSPLFADDPVYTLGYTKNDKNSAYATEYTVSSGNVEWKVYANISTNAGYYIGGKGTSNLTRTFTSTDYISSSIDKIVIHTSTMDAGSASVTAKASTSSNFASGVKNFSSVNLGANNDYEINCDEGTDANSYFQLTFTVNPNNSKNNKKVVVTSIDFYEHVASSEIVTGVSASIKDGDYYIGDKLSQSDFDVTISWSGDKADTKLTNGFTWTVNGVADGTLTEENNSVVVTYQEVSSQPFNVEATIEPGTTEDNPLTAGQAYNKGYPLANKNETAKSYYIFGVVSDVITNNLAEANNNATFWLQNGETAHGFEAFEITPAAGCTNYSDLRVGAEVLIKSTIYRYNSTIETGPTFKSLLSISYTAPTLAGISLNKTTLKLEVGNFETLTASPDPIGAELGDVTWETSNDKVATVDENGKVTGVGEGSATITASAGGFTATCNITVELCATLDLTTTAAVTSASEELLTWEVANKFELRIDKNTATTAADNYYPGKSNYTSTRFYANQIVTLIPNNDYAGIRAEFVAKSNTYAKALKNSTFTNATASLPDGNEAVVVTVTFTDGVKPLIVKIGATCGFESVKLFYTEKTARQTVETSQTQTSLSYHYEGNSTDGFTYSNISVRFGGVVNKNVWSELNTDNNLITGFGVIIADGDLVTDEKDMADAMSDVVSSTVTTTFTQEVYAIDYFVPVADMASTIGEDENNYFWNLRWSIDSANMDKMYSAVAYIKVGDEYVVMNMARESVETMATKYVASGNYSGTVADSLQYIVDHAQQA